MRSMKTRLALLACLALLALAGQALAGAQDFLLVNQTGKVIDQLYVVPNNARTWEDDILGRDVLLPGESTEIVFSPQEQDCVWDIMVVDKHGQELWWEDINLCKNRRVVLTFKKGEPMAYYD